MAKSKSFFGLRTGSTKSLTFQVYRGQQITKDRVTRVANPRTTLQMEQRSKLPIAAAARSALKGLVDHSFEGVPYGEQSLRTFSSKNLSAGALKVYSYASPDAPSPGIAEYQVSQGTLRGFNLSASSTDYHYRFTLPAKIGKGPIVPAMPKGTKGSTVLYHLMSYFAENKIDGLRAGQQLTFLALNVPYYKVLNYVGGSNSGTYDVPVTRFDVARLIMPDISKISGIATYHDDNDEFELDSEITGEGSNTFVLTRADGFHIKFFVTDQEYGFSCWFQPTGKDDITVASALIVSELVNNVWKRSTSNLHVSNAGTNPLVKKVFSFDQWASLYAPKQIVSSKYLNMGNAATGISGQTATGISGQRQPRRDLGPAGVNAATGISGQRPPQSDVERADGNAATGNSDQNG